MFHILVSLFVMTFITALKYNLNWQVSWKKIRWTRQIATMTQLIHSFNMQIHNSSG